MNKIKTIYISYWFNELDNNPASKVYELEDEVRSIIDEPLHFAEDNDHNNLIIPRIQGISHDNKYLFTVSYINAILTINVNDITIDEAVLLINSNIQLFYDIIKRIYNIDILYSSVKLEMIDDTKKAKENLIKCLNQENRDYDNLTIKKGFRKESYYINYFMEYTTEYTFDFKKEYSENDVFNKSMVTSLKDGKKIKEYLFTVIEVNDRYAYNLDSAYRTTKDELRGLIMEIKDILNKEDYWK